MAGFVVIASSDVTAGFRLGGFDCIEISKGAPGAAEAVGSLLEEIEKEGRYGIICIDEGLLKLVPEGITERYRKSGLPVIVPISIPDEWGEAEPEESPIVRLIRRAIGYHIKLRK